MLTRLSLTNFQKHSCLDIDLAPVTSFVGPTGSGKSSVLRGLNWLMTNRPTGSRFIKRREKCCRVEVEVDDRIVVREKDKENAYYLDDRKYEAVSSSVPDDIVHLLNVGECNYQSQREGTLYWFALSDGEVSKELDKVVDLSLIDRIMKVANARIKSQKQHIDHEQAQWDAVRSECDRLAWIEEADVRLAEVESLVHEQNKKQDFADRLEQLLDELEKAERRRPNVPPPERIDEIGDLIDLRDGLRSGADQLERLFDELERANKVATTARDRWREAMTKLREQVGKVCPTCRRPL